MTAPEIAARIRAGFDMMAWDEYPDGSGHPTVLEKVAGIVERLLAEETQRLRAELRAAATLLRAERISDGERF
jgi:hypothetical protein